MQIKNIEELTNLISAIGHNALFRLILNNLIEFEFKEEKEISTKQLMTRAEAVDLFKHKSASGAPDDIIDFYIRSGMLKVKEENWTFDEILKHFGVNDVKECNRVIAANGYMVSK